MSYPVTCEMRALIEQLHDLQPEVDMRLGLVSTAARDEWQRTRSRIPTLDQVISGIVAVSHEDLAEMRSKIARLIQILSNLDPSARLALERAPARRSS
jgi:uncharacterized coiled-coil protein SlyX